MNSSISSGSIGGMNSSMSSCNSSGGRNGSISNSSRGDGRNSSIVGVTIIEAVAVVCCQPSVFNLSLVIVTPSDVCGH